MRSLAVLLVVVVVSVLGWWRLERSAAPPPRTAPAASASGHPAAALLAPTVGAVPRAAVAGLVTGDRGEPVPLARVCARGRSERLDPETLRDPTCTMADPAGRFEIEGLVPASYQIVATAASRQPALHRVELHAGDRVTGIGLTLASGGVELAGVVVDLTGGPIAHALVTAGDGLATTDDAGRFVVWTRPGTVPVSAAASGYADAANEAHAPGRVELALTPESILSGVVVDATTHEPVAGARVDVASDGAVAYSEYIRVQTTSDSQGRFRVTRLLPGRYRAEARAPHAYGRATASIRVGLGQTAETAVPMFPAFQVSGTVVESATKTPCEGAEVWLHERTYRQRVRPQLGDDHVLRAEGVIPGTYRVVVECPGMQARELEAPVVVSTGDVLGLVWEVQPGATIRGRILDATGSPVADARISARNDASSGRAASGTTKSDAAGTYELTGLEPGTYTVTASSPRGWLDGGVEVVAATQVPATLDLHLAPVGAIAGTVVDATGHPMANVLVEASDGRGHGSGEDHRTDATGAFRLEGLPPGDYRVVALRDLVTPLRRPGSTDETRQGEAVSVGPGAVATTRLVVEAETGTIGGRVVDATGAPIVDAFVTAARDGDLGGAPGSAWYQGTRPVVTDLDGNFLIDRLAPGTYTVRAYWRGGGEAMATQIAVGSAGVTLALAATGSIAGQVRLPAETPFVWVEVSEPSRGYSATEELYRTDGLFRFEGLPAGRFQIRAFANGLDATIEVPLAVGEARTGIAIDLGPR